MLKSKNIPVGLFIEGLRNENSGDFGAAVVAYESALQEVKKSRFNSGLENKITEKLKLLHTVIQYEEGLRFVR